MKKFRMYRLLRELRVLWRGQPLTVARARRTWEILFRFITGKVFLLAVLIATVAAVPILLAVLVAAAANAHPFDLLPPPAQVSTASPAPDIQILVVSIDPSICPPCARLEPVIDDLQSKGYNLMTVGSIPRIRDFPTILIYRDKKLVDTITGYVDSETIEARIHAQSTP